MHFDKDEGKINEGNNRFDNGEALSGVEVTLYDTNNNQIGITITNNDGYYEFLGINAQKRYYVKFVYNGMLYTNVLYNRNGDDTSKATEDGQGHGSNRQNFNNKFAEIGSYPSNYRTIDCITGEEIYNRTYLQEDIAKLFQEVAEEVVRNGGNETAAYQAVINKYQQTDADIRSKVQFVADCRIKAYTVETYPLNPVFVIDPASQVVAGQGYAPIYSGTYNQLNVNLGIKARQTVDMRLYKDILKAEVRINGKSEIYEYDERKGSGNGFSIGVSEADYLNGLRGEYINKQKYTNVLQTREIEQDKYEINMRTEEVANGQSSNYNGGVTGQINNNYQINYDYSNLREVNGVNQDRLKIYVTYKIAIQNESRTVGAVTEIVDYYDPRYEFYEAYEGDEAGNRIGEVTKAEESIYANRGNNMYKSKNGTYKTMYLRPNEEKRITDNSEKEKKQYIYVTLELLGEERDAGNLLSKYLLNNNKVTTINLAEINGYKTYNSMNKGDNSSPGLIDIDSNPGNLDISNIGELTDANIINYPNIREMYEDDTSRAPAYVYQIMESRTVEGRVFEDEIMDTSKVGNTRYGDGKIGEEDRRINGVIVELIEIKNGQMVVRASTKTNEEGWYGFTGFLPGDYTIRYTYGADNDTAMTKASANGQIGLNERSYNGQDYQATTYGRKGNEEIETRTYNTDGVLVNRYSKNNQERNQEEGEVKVAGSTIIERYNREKYYWYTIGDNVSDAWDDEYRKGQVIEYARSEYGKEIVNHKAEVFNAYINPQPEHLSEKAENGVAKHEELVKELERRTYRIAYTAEMPIEVEYAKQTVGGNYKNGERYEYKIIGVDFGIEERPIDKIEIVKNVKNIKVVGADGGTVLFDTDRGVNNLMWIRNEGEASTAENYKQGLIQITMDDELISGARIEITYSFKVTNKGEIDGNTTTRAKTIIDYVDNGLTFDKQDGENRLWEVVEKEQIQTDKNSTFVSNAINPADTKNKTNLVDISTKQIILQTTQDNPLTKALAPGESTQEVTLVLKKVLSAESSTDDLTYENMIEIVEVENTVGRYDHTSTPGDQSPEEPPKQDDSAESELITILPPFGESKNYYIIGAVMLVVLGIGIYLIKKKVLDRK